MRFRARGRSRRTSLSRRRRPTSGSASSEATTSRERRKWRRRRRLPLQRRRSWSPQRSRPTHGLTGVLPLRVRGVCGPRGTVRRTRCRTGHAAAKGHARSAHRAAAGQVARWFPCSKCPALLSRQRKLEPAAQCTRNRCDGLELRASAAGCSGGAGQKYLLKRGVSAQAFSF